MIKLTVLVKRNPALSVEEFHEEWRAHGRMIADEPVFARYIRRYEQHHRVPADYRNGDTFDGMVLQWFDSYADFLALLQTPEYAAKMQPDETRILDLPGHGDPVHRGGRGLPAVTDPRRRHDHSARDGITRCWWCGDDPLYVDYHDREWGTPLRDERALFELLCLEGFQAGLSWITILRKRVAFREAFDGFDPEVVARYTERDVERLLGQPRHRPPPRARSPPPSPTRSRSGAMREAGTSLKQIVWSHAPVARRAPLTRSSRDPRRDAGVGRARPRAAQVGDALRRRHHRLRVHAVGRPGRRPPRRLPPRRPGRRRPAA